LQVLAQMVAPNLSRLGLLFNPDEQRRYLGFARVQ
jgi:hypothetical protein